MLGGASFTLAQKGEYDASMGALGTAVAVATARGDSDRTSEQGKEWMAENERLRLANGKLEIELALAEQQARFQDMISRKEMENVELRAENRFLSAQQKANLLPESKLESFHVGSQETESVEDSTNLGDENDATNV